MGHARSTDRRTPRRRGARSVIDLRLLVSRAATLSPPAPPRAPGAPATEPVTIRAAAGVATGFVLPPPPPAPDESRPPVLPLDWARIETTLAETAAVAAVLADLFPDEALPPPPSADAHSARSGVGLSGAHAALARALAQRPTWRRAAVAALATRLGLFPTGAVEHINDAAVERWGAPLCEGDDPIEVNPGVAQEVVA